MFNPGIRHISNSMLEKVKVTQNLLDDLLQLFVLSLQLAGFLFIVVVCGWTGLHGLLLVRLPLTTSDKPPHLHKNTHHTRYNNRPDSCWQNINVLKAAQYCTVYYLLFTKNRVWTHEQQTTIEIVIVLKKIDIKKSVQIWVQLKFDCTSRVIGSLIMCRSPAKKI